MFLLVVAELVNAAGQFLYLLPKVSSLKIL